MKQITFILFIFCCVIIESGNSQEIDVIQQNQFNYLQERFYITNLFTYNNDCLIYTMEPNPRTMDKFTFYDEDLQPTQTIEIEKQYMTASGMCGYQEILHFGVQQGPFQKSVPFTQTLFNDDEVIEFLVKEYKSAAVNVAHHIITEYGDTLGTFMESAYTTRFYGYTSSGSNYLVVEEGNDDKNNYRIYRIVKSNGKGDDGDPTSLEQISFKKMPYTFATPNPVRQEGSLKIYISEVLVSANNFVRIVDMNGITVYHQKIAGNEQEISVSIDGFAKGQYLYSIISDIREIDTGKIIIR